MGVEHPEAGHTTKNPRTTECTGLGASKRSTTTSDASAVKVVAQRGQVTGASNASELAGVKVSFMGVSPSVVLIGSDHVTGAKSWLARREG